MATKSRHKTIERLTPTQYELLRDLTDDRATDSATLEADLTTVVTTRLELAEAMLEAARVLGAHADALVRRSTASRAYYAAYQTGRAIVFAVHRRYEDDHEKLPGAIDRLLGQTQGVGETLKELRRLRNEMDYSPHPGPDAKTEYDSDEIDVEVGNSIREAGRVIGILREYLERRR